MKGFLIGIVILMSAQVFAQSVVVKGVVFDDVDSEPIRGVKVSLVGEDKTLSKTDSKGVFQFEYTFQKGDSLYFDHIAYTNRHYSITKRVMRKTVGDTLFLRIQMNIRVLGELKIKDPSIPDTIYGSEEHSVSDFEFYEDKYIMLAYDQTLKKGSKVMLVSRENKLLAEARVPDRAENLFKDFMGNVNVICDNAVYLVEVFGHTIYVTKRDKDTFTKLIAPVVDTLNNKMYYSNFNKDYPAFEYYCYDPVDSSNTEVCKIEDEFIMELYRAEYKYVDGSEKVWAMNMEDDTGVDKEIWIGLKYFTSNLYYKSLYAPMFVVDGEIVVFDHYGNELRIYDDEHDLVEAHPISYQYIKGRRSWEDEVIKDEDGVRVYTVLSEGGYQMLAEIDLTTGQLADTHKLHFKYVENIHVKNGEVYYIYRPFESSQKKFLYKEKLENS